MQAHALATIDANKDDATPDTDELLLKLLAEWVVNPATYSLSPGDLLAKAQERESALFQRWSSRGVAAALKRYGIVAMKSHGTRSYRDVSAGQLVRIEQSYGLDLGLPQAVKDLSGTEG